VRKEQNNDRSIAYTGPTRLNGRMEFVKKILSYACLQLSDIRVPKGRRLMFLTVEVK
jgi:hypothetical protein